MTVRQDALMALVELLRQLRAERRIKLEDAGRAMNVSREEYFDIEKGRLLPERHQLEQLAKYYSLCPGFFDSFF